MLCHIAYSLQGYIVQYTFPRLKLDDTHISYMRMLLLHQHLGECMSTQQCFGLHAITTADSSV